MTSEPEPKVPLDQQDDMWIHRTIMILGAQLRAHMPSVAMANRIHDAFTDLLQSACADKELAIRCYKIIDAAEDTSPINALKVYDCLKQAVIARKAEFGEYGFGSLVAMERSSQRMSRLDARIESLCRERRLPPPKSLSMILSARQVLRGQLKLFIKDVDHAQDIAQLQAGLGLGRDDLRALAEEVRQPELEGDGAALVQQLQSSKPLQAYHRTLSAEQLRAVIEHYVGKSESSLEKSLTQDFYDIDDPTQARGAAVLIADAVSKNTWNNNWHHPTEAWFKRGRFRVTPTSANGPLTVGGNGTNS